MVYAIHDTLYLQYMIHNTCNIWYIVHAIHIIYIRMQRTYHKHFWAGGYSGHDTNKEERKSGDKWGKGDGKSHRNEMGRANKEEERVTWVTDARTHACMYSKHPHASWTEKLCNSEHWNERHGCSVITILKLAFSLYSTICALIFAGFIFRGFFIFADFTISILQMIAIVPCIHWCLNFHRQTFADGC